MYKEGTRIKLVYTKDPYTNLKPGDTGIITGHAMMPFDMGMQVYVKWDNGSALAMLPSDGDRFKIISD